MYSSYLLSHLFHRRPTVRIYAPNWPGKSACHARLTKSKRQNKVRTKTNCWHRHHGAMSAILNLHSRPWRSVRHTSDSIRHIRHMQCMHCGIRVSRAHFHDGRLLTNETNKKKKQKRNSKRPSALAHTTNERLALINLLFIVNVLSRWILCRI